MRRLWRPDSPQTFIIAGACLRVLEQNERARAELPYDLVFLVERFVPEPSYATHEPKPDYRFTYRNTNGIEPTCVELERRGVPPITEERR